MKDKKGFTLVELLSVIAILAILVIIALPNVLKLFRNAKQNTFVTEVQNLVRSAEDKYLTSSMLNGSNTCFDSVTNPLDMNGRNNLKYVIKLSDKGAIIEIKVTDDSYELLAENTDGINRADIGNKYKVNTLQESTSIIGCSGDVIQEGNTLGLPLVIFGENEESVPSRGYIKNGKLIREDGKTELNKLDKIPSKKGNKFLGYFIPETERQIIDEEGNIIEENLSNISETITLERKWEIQKYEISFDMQGGDGGTSSIEVYYGSLASNIEIPVINNVIFDGYYTEKNGQGDKYFDKNGKSIKEYDLEDNVILYAKWNFTKDFSYIENNNYTLEIPMTGTYKIELWGASGGNAVGIRNNIGGKGAYVSGETNFNKGMNLYFTIGGQGKDTVNSDDVSQRKLDGGYNGGGSSTGIGNCWGASGGGATHVALVPGLLSTLKDQNDKLLMVASAGGGASRDTSRATYEGHGGNAGIYNGYDGNTAGNEQCLAYGATLTSGGKSCMEDLYGDFGQAQRGSGYFNGDGGGGGSGFYAGGSSNCSGGGGGSSFINGGENFPTLNTIYKFNNIIALDGNSSMSSPSGENEVGHTGNGYARITLIK